MQQLAGRMADHPMRLLLPHSTSEHEMERVGRHNDGGYVVARLPGSYDAMVSAGIGDDASFEAAMLERHPDLRCTAFDGTIPELPRGAPSR